MAFSRHTYLAAETVLNGAHALARRYVNTPLASLADTLAERDYDTRSRWVEHTTGTAPVNATYPIQWDAIDARRKLLDAAPNNTWTQPAHTVGSLSRRLCPAFVQVRWNVQARRRGYADSDLWDVGRWVARTLPTELRTYVNSDHVSAHDAPVADTLLCAAERISLFSVARPVTDDQAAVPGRDGFTLLLLAFSQHADRDTVFLRAWAGVAAQVVHDFAHTTACYPSDYPGGYNAWYEALRHVSNDLNEFSAHHDLAAGYTALAWLITQLDDLWS
jgi:hypothetical protein